ncbi:MAG: outer membrane protein assembly factor BamA [Pseudomonadales bacterium]|nr:outer membrane protein assembly factor BamA [Pseudomonadales bacterium]
MHSFTQLIKICAIVLLTGFLTTNKLFAEADSSSPVSTSSPYPIQVGDIRLEGLQRVSPASVFANLPFTIQQSVNALQIQRSISALFKTGNFDDIAVSLDGDVIVFQLQERPAIAEINIEGNKQLKTEDLLAGLARSGLTQGQVFKRETLEQIRLELQRQYTSQGRYDADITANVIELPQNRINLNIDVYEGSTAEIKHLNIVGNQRFSTEELLDMLELRDSDDTWWWSSKDKYSRERLRADIEKLESFYRDQGYLNFRVASTQVALGPYKDEVFVTINVEEGDIYTISEIKLSGELTISEDIIRRIILLRPGGIYSQSRITSSQELISRLLGAEGYAFASVRHYPKANAEDKTVELTFFVDPGQRTYVRRVEFRGNTGTQDEVLRREMRQMEAAPASAQKIEQSKVNLQRLGFFKTVESEMIKVPGEEDLVDVVFTVEEQPSGSVGASIGYSDSGGLVLSANLSQKNFLGSGNKVSFGVSKNDYQISYNFNYTNPYYTVDGVSRGFGLFFKETDFDKLGVAEFSTNTYGATLNYGYPINETTRLGFGFGYANILIETGPFASQEVISSPRPDNDIDFYQQVELVNGEIIDVDPALREIFALEASGIDPYIPFDQGFIDRNGDEYDSFTVNLSWSQSELNRGFMPTDGFSHNFTIESGLPETDLEYWKAIYRGQYFINIKPELAIRLHGRLGIGGGYGDTTELPFFENFYAGGFGSVRGYERSSLGPKGTPSEGYLTGAGRDAFNNLKPTYYYDEVANKFVAQPLTRQDTIGGNMLVESGVELIFPLWFIKDRRSLRTVLFIDSGNVFDTDCGILQETCYDISELDQLRASYGLGLTWVSALGPLTFSLSEPFNNTSSDDTKFFQFSIGTGF